MSDLEPELPSYLIDAIMSESPPAEAVELVKNAFTWRTIDAELLAMSYDSAGDLAGVRDASAQRTLEWTAGDVSIVVEINGTVLTGQISPAGAGTVTLRSLRDPETAIIEESDAGSFRFASTPVGPVVLVFDLDDQTFESPAFTLR